ncbi:phosphoglycolate phosphatase [Thermomonospora umbrina]|uniref:Phosphoglycolate phosphatase n=1 Tax=Thermomonospora umbrina TaxID=111806 RepID=A0A3D9SKG1_9ACTN|nr:phosphoglycolate phosphatase [Thermomonospora umbrina]
MGFDLDLTLADTRRGIGACFEALVAETGVSIDIPTVLGRLGPPLEHELSYWFPASEVDAMAARYRAMYGGIAVPASEAMPGASAAIEAVRALGGRTVVVSAKNERHARATVEFLGLPVDEVVGGLFAAAKGVALREHGVSVYVGDHTADVDAARAAEAHSVGVATGPFDAEALRAYGADVVLPDLVAFPDWFALRPSGGLNPYPPGPDGVRPRAMA